MENALNENIKKLRLQYGFSQVELANKLNVSKQCISNWENDNILPSIAMLVKMADLFNVSTDYLLGRTADSAINATGLTEEQITHIRLLIRAFIACNQK